MNKYQYLQKAKSSGFNIPSFGKMEDFHLFEGNILILRSSPNVSLPGCFNSYFDLKTKEDIEKAYEEMKKPLNSPKIEFLKKRLNIKNLILDAFIQIQKDGVSGVAHTHNLKGEFQLNFEVSSKRGSVTDGVKTENILNKIQIKQLEELNKKIFNSFRMPMEFEFIFSDDLYLLQVRKQIVEVEMSPNLLNSMTIEEVEFYFSEIKTIPNKDIFPTNLTEICGGIPLVLGRFKGVFGKDILFLEDLLPGQEHLLENVKGILTSAETKFCHLVSLCAKMNIPILTKISKKDIEGLENEIYVDCFKGKIFK